VVVWKGVDVDGKRLRPNIQEMPRAVELARKFSLDYISFKPCLIRGEESQRETLLQNVGPSKESEIAKEIKIQLQMAREIAGDQVKILESSNLKAMLDQETERIKRQPKRCHMQFYRTVVSPFGIYHCPAFRGVEIAKIAERTDTSPITNSSRASRELRNRSWPLMLKKNAKRLGVFIMRPTGGWRR
jgi:hypothetical protein